MYFGKTLSNKTSAGKWRKFYNPPLTGTPQNHHLLQGYCTLTTVLIYLIIFIGLTIVFLIHLHYSDRRLDDNRSEKLLNKWKLSNQLVNPTCQSSFIRNVDRLDCYPQQGANPTGCESRNCCWSPVSTPNVPYCYYPLSRALSCYQYVNYTESKFRKVAYIEQICSSPYPNDIKVLKMIISYETESRLRIKIVDATKARWEPPYPEVPIVTKRPYTHRQYDVITDPTKVGFKIVRKTDQTILFDASSWHNFIYSDQFLQITGRLPVTSRIYGLGEHRHHFALPLNWTRLTFFNHDAVPSFDKNLYGTHPFYLLVEETGVSHGVFLRNSDPMDVILQPTPAITFRPIGGVLDLYFFLGPKPNDVITQYTDLIGRPALPPYWALGFHLCRFGYRSLNETRSVMDRTIQADIPLDTQWNDLDYMNDSNDFTYDHKAFKGLPDFVHELHANGMHYVIIVDPGVSAGEGQGEYAPYDVGLALNVFIKNSTGGVFVGKVWNRKSTVWPDFTNPNCTEYWTRMLKSLYDLVPFDGAWIDMNEPSNFLSGSFNGCPSTKYERPPYVPAIDGNVLDFKTVCLSAEHFIGRHYDVHNLYGMSEGVVTNFALNEIRTGRRPFIISRSTFAGSGKFTGHWSGDVYSNWLDMRYSVPQLLSFSLFGIPLMGADICGFNGNTTQALCNRWHQLGAFYPFARNHNTDNGRDQDPVAMGPLVLQSARKSLRIRYSLLPYLYTLFAQAHINGITVARPLFFEFATDKNTHPIDTQFLWGPALMICPVLDEFVSDHVDAYLPEGVWYNFYDGQRIQSAGRTVRLDAPPDTIPLLVRGGYILPQQAPERTTTRMRQNPFELLVAADLNGTAKGYLYWDDGDSIGTFEDGRYTWHEFRMQPGQLLINKLHWGYNLVPLLRMITIWGVANVNHVTVNTKDYPNFRFNTSNLVLTVDKLALNLTNDNVITWL